MDYSILVNKSNPIANSYFDNLSLVDCLDIDGNKISVEKTAYNMYINLSAYLKTKNIFIEIASAYRSIEEQQEIIDEFTKKYGADYVSKYAAPIRTSEHHTGLAIDLALIVDGIKICENEDLLKYEDIFFEIHQSLSDYGFILRYPKGKEDITGYGYEPWHIRYVGKELAKYLYKNNLTLEEYVEKQLTKVIIFDWGGVIMHRDPVENNDKQAIIRVIKSFNPTLSDDEAWDVYLNSLIDENGIYISQQCDEVSKAKWVERLNNLGNFNASLQEFSEKFSAGYLSVGYYSDLIDYMYSLKDKCQIGLFSDLIYGCTPALNKQLDLSKFDNVWLSYQTGLRKNTEDAFILIENDLLVSPENILFIDDSTVNIMNAKKRGWQTCQAFGYEIDKIKASVTDFLNN